jgi:dihydrofolate reductase
MIGQEGGSTGTDDSWLRRGEVNVGATVMGRNMFGPVRGPWLDDSWVGWWGDEPPYHHPVFVLTHHARPPLEMAGGTTFHFVTDGLDSALRQATEAAAGRDVRLGGGVATVRDALRRGLVDELHVPVVPVLLGSGERLWEDVGTWPLGYTCTRIESSDAVAHMLFERD